MDYTSFNDWLIESKEMSERSAKDVISRCRRVCKLLKLTNLSPSALIELSKNTEFNNKSMFIKSQLKRAVSLWFEYGGIECR